METGGPEKLIPSRLSWSMNLSSSLGRGGREGGREEGGEGRKGEEGEARKREEGEGRKREEGEGRKG